MATLSEMRLAQELMTQFQRGNVEGLAPKLEAISKDKELVTEVAERIKSVIRNDVSYGRLSLFDKIRDVLGRETYPTAVADAISNGLILGAEDVIRTERFGVLADLYHDIDAKDNVDLRFVKRAMNLDKSHLYYFISGEKLGLRDPALLIIDIKAESPPRIAFGGAVRDGEKEKVVKGPMTMSELTSRWNPPTHWNPETRQEEKGNKALVLARLAACMDDMKRNFPHDIATKISQAREVCALAARQMPAPKR